MFEAVHGVPVYDRSGQITPAVQKILNKYGDGADTIEEVLANYGLKEMAGFNFNIIEMAIDSKNLFELDNKLDLEKKQAFLYLLEQYDEVNTSWKTFADASYEVVTDWTNWAGLLTLGAGTAASFGAKKLGKEAVLMGIKETLRKGIKATTKTVGLKTQKSRLTGLAMLEGGLHMGYYDNTRQNVELDIRSDYIYKEYDDEELEELKDEYLDEHYSVGQTLAMAGLGSAAAGGMYLGMNKLIGKAAEKRANKKLAQMQENHRKAVEQSLEEARKILDNAPNNTISRMLAEGKSMEEVLDFAEKEARNLAAKQGNEVVDEPLQVIKVGNRKWSVEGSDKVYKTKKAASEAAAKSTKSQDPRPYAQNVEFFKNATEVIRRIMDNPESVDEIIASIDNTRLTMAQTEKLASMINEANSILQMKWLEAEGALMNKALSKEERESLLKEATDALAKAEKAKALKDHVNAYAGRTLQDIQNWITYKTEIGEPPTQAAIDKAHVKYYQKTIEDIVNKSQKAIDKAYNEGNFLKARELTNKRNNSVEMVEAFRGLEKYDPRLANKLSDDPASNATVFEQYLEMSIAGYFSPTTIQYNTVFPFLKTITMPLTDTLLQNPLKMAAWRKAGHQYAALLGAQKASIRAARMAADLEHSTLTADPARFYDGGVKTKGRVAKFLRIFSRAVAFSDAYLQEGIAASFLTAKHYDILMQEGVKKGLKGNKLSAYITEHIQDRVATAYDRSLSEQIVKPVVEAANNLNLKGADKEKFILDRLQREGGVEALKRLTDDEAVDMINNMLYKKPFDRVYKDKKTGKYHWEYNWTENPIRHTAEMAEEYAAKWDDFVKHHPVLRLFTTIFWRTPVRLINETMRKTPAVQSLMPEYVDDLAGVNGASRKARAVTETYLGYAVLMFTISKYAQDEITKGSGIDWSKKASRSNNEEEMQALHVELFGEEVPYARFEPLRALMQFQVDVLEKHRLRVNHEAMGKYEVGAPTDFERYAQEYTKDMGILLATAVQVIRDTGLLTGAVETVEGIGKISESLGQNEDDTVSTFAEIGKLITSKLTGIFPSTIKKSQTAFLDVKELEAPQNFYDRILQKIAPNDIGIPRQYGWDGEVLLDENPKGSMIGFYPVEETLPENRKSKEWHEVDALIRRIEYLGLATLTRPAYRNPTHFGNKDLRSIEIPVSNGKLFNRTVSLYDIIHNKMAELNKNGEFTRQLLSYARSNAPLGTPDNPKKSQLVEGVQDIFADWRKAAIMSVINQYPEAQRLHENFVISTEQASEAN